MSHPFPICVQDKLFKTKNGDLCLCLHEVWPSLLTDLSMLGTVFLITRCDQLALASICRQVDFVPVPGGTEMLDLSSGLCLDTANLGSVMAGLEAHSGHLGFHFFDWTGIGFLKVILGPGADLDGFVQLMSHYGKRPLTLPPNRSASRVTCEGVVLATELDDLQKTWASFNPTCGGSFLPKGERISWLDALRLAGRERALFLTKVGVIKVMLAAYQEQMPLQITTWSEGLHHTVKLTPLRLERCSQCLHLFDVETEVHLFFESDFEAWIGFHGIKRMPVIHLFSDKGERCGLIQFAGKSSEIKAWSKGLHAASGYTHQAE